MRTPEETKQALDAVNTHLQRQKSCDHIFRLPHGTTAYLRCIKCGATINND
jgi:hypothetical protein